MKMTNSVAKVDVHAEEQFLDVSASFAEFKNCSYHRKSSMGPERRYSRCDFNWKVGTEE